MQGKVELTEAWVAMWWKSVCGCMCVCVRVCACTTGCIHMCMVEDVKYVSLF